MAIKFSVRTKFKANNSPHTINGTCDEGELCKLMKEIADNITTYGDDFNPAK